MKTKLALIVVVLFVTTGVVLFGQLDFFKNNDKVENSILTDIDKSQIPRIRSSFSPKNRDDANSRMQYEFNRLKDPRTGKIPKNIRLRELQFAKKLPTKGDLLRKGKTSIFAENWVFRGPFNVGGRTRALAVDMNYNGTSNQRILAGGVSGGMYLSQDDGATWTRTTSNSSIPSVTCLAQDPNNTQTWYYGTGEFLGNSAGGTVGSYFGHGIFKSTDNGETWTQLSSTVENNSLNSFDNIFDFVWNIAVHPDNSDVFAARLVGISRSTDGGNSWNTVLFGQVDASRYSQMTDVAIAPDGTVYATLSRNGVNLQAGEFGVFRSDDGGTQWSNISPPGLSSDPYRMVLGTAPSDANTLYVLVQANANGATAQDHQLFRYDASNNSWTDLSANLPDEQGVEGNSSFSSQGGYDLIVSVKPDNPEVLWIGGTNLYRSTDGGQSFTRVGGYAGPQNYLLYESHHPDLHSQTYYPNNPNWMISGHDGGLSRTTNALEQPQTWTSLNNGYITTQFYGIAIDPNPGNDALILGGMQDNGSWGVESTNTQADWIELLSGDGGFAAIAPGGLPFYVSSQNGFIVRVSSSNNQLVQSVVTPQGASNYLFIAPYLLDPNNADVMYLAAGNTVWRNSALSGIPVGNGQATNTNWSALGNSAVANTQITALTVSETPADRLYFGATNYQNASYIVRVDNAPNNPAGSDITPPGVTGGSLPSCIAVNPLNGDEIITTFSNYNVPSIFYSDDGGNTWTDVEGNLAGAEGPSIRWAEIIPDGGYYLATSTGVYSTSSLNGGNTTWSLEAANVIGNVVVDMLDARHEDGFLVAGTHGRGTYSAEVSVGGTPVASVSNQQLSIESKPDESGKTTFTLENTGDATLTYQISASGDFGDKKANRFNGVLDDQKAEYSPIPRTGNTFSSSLPAGVHSPQSGEIRSAKPSNLPLEILQTDVLYLDDGDNTADDFIGFGDGITDLTWLNQYDISGFNFQLEQMQFFMRTENVAENPVYVAALDAQGNVLAEGNLDLGLAANGDWYTVNFNPSIDFNDGETFALVVGASGSIFYPAGTDLTATVPNKSFYYDPSTDQFVNLNTIQGYENGAFLLRAVGTVTTGENENPVAVAQISTNQANVGETITFDGSGSYDNDGQVVQYQWNFGDGSNSSDSIATHAYSQPNTFTYTLTVTDDQGATGQTSGQITVSDNVNRLTVQPSSGSLAAGGNETITVILDAQGLAEGTYQGEVTITGNGGTLNIPLTMVVDATVAIEKQAGLPNDFVLRQNYPNPFNPETRIAYTLPTSANVEVEVFDLNGRKVRNLVAAFQSPGEYEIRWNGKDNSGRLVSSGVYIYFLKAISSDGSIYRASHKMTLLK